MVGPVVGVVPGEGVRGAGVAEAGSGAVAGLGALSPAVAALGGGAGEACGGGAHPEGVGVDRHARPEAPGAELRGRQRLPRQAEVCREENW